MGTEMLFDLAVVGTLLAGGVQIVCWFRRPASAAHRAMLWQASLATLLLVPALSILVPLGRSG